jgi:hypothetical protein
VSRVRAPGAAHQQALHVVTHLLGSRRLPTILSVVLFLMAIGWAGDSLFEWLSDLGIWLKDGEVKDWWPWHRLIAVGFMAATIGVVSWLARKAEAHFRPRVLADATPAQAEGLILYLSALRGPDLAQLEAARPGPDSLDAFRRDLGNLNWRMPLEAIAYHLPRLRQVVVISSAHVDGSRKQFPTFKELVGRLFPGAELRVQDVAELDSRYDPGLDFNDVEKVAAATDDAYVRLRETGLRADRILIDITGGLKTNSIAGAAVALAEGRRIQYVSNAYEVLAYDVTYGH